MAAPIPTPSEARQTAVDLVEQARHAALESPRRTNILAEAQVFATLSLGPETVTISLDEPVAPKPSTRKRAPKATTPEVAA